MYPFIDYFINTRGKRWNAVKYVDYNDTQNNKYVVVGSFFYYSACYCVPMMGKEFCSRPLL